MSGTWLLKVASRSVLKRFPVCIVQPHGWGYSIHVAFILISLHYWTTGSYKNAHTALFRVNKQTHLFTQ